MSPIDGSAGYSEYTNRVKQPELVALLRIAAPIYLNTASKWRGTPLTIVDLTAGPGDTGGRDGSPLLLIAAFADLLTSKAPNKAVQAVIDQWPTSDIRFVLCERNGGTASRLYEAIDQNPAAQIVGRDRITVLAEDNASELLRLGERAPGLVYWDGNPDDRIPLGALATLKRRSPRIDLLLNIAINGGFKRRREDPVPTVDALLGLKDHWTLRHVASSNPQQFVFLLGSNWLGDTNNWAKRLKRLDWRNCDPGQEGDVYLRGLCRGDDDQLEFDV